MQQVATNPQQFLIVHYNTKSYTVTYTDPKAIFIPLDYNDQVVMGDELSVEVVFDSRVGYMKRTENVIVVNPLFKKPKVTSFYFRRRQAWERTKGFRARATYVKLMMEK